MLAPSDAGPQSYDLCIAIAGRQLHWRNRNHGVTLSQDTMAWTMDADANETAYGNIVAVHLESRGQKVTEDRCTITFSDGRRGLLIVNTDPGGYADATQVARYRDFVRDLHAHLPAELYPSIRFSASVPRRRYWTMMIAAIAGAPIFAAAGLAGFFLFHLWQGVLLFALGEYFCWTLLRRALANTPRDYTPDALPDALLT
jgi:hypothetical protein